MRLNDLYAKLTGGLARHLEGEIETALSRQIYLFEGGVNPTPQAVARFVKVVSPKRDSFSRHKPMFFTWTWKTIPMLQLVATPRNSARDLDLQLITLDLPDGRNLPAPSAN